MSSVCKYTHASNSSQIRCLCPFCMLNMCMWYVVHGMRYEVRGMWYVVQCTKYMVRGTRYEVQNTLYDY
jgi:hypothetical protein